jgi:hypothetical protein
VLHRADALGAQLRRLPRGVDWRCISWTWHASPPEGGVMMAIALELHIERGLLVGAVKG